jgi:hypothetical protein
MRTSIKWSCYINYISLNELIHKSSKPNQEYNMFITDLAYVEVIVADVNGANAGGTVNVSGGGEIFEATGSSKTKNTSTSEHGRFFKKSSNKSEAGFGAVNGGGQLTITSYAH